MAKEIKATNGRRKAAMAPRIFTATLRCDGAVVKEREITERQAVQERQAQRDVVVCGHDSDENSDVAKRIENTANGQLRAPCEASRARLEPFSTEVATARWPYFLRNEGEQGAQGMKYFTPELFIAFNSSDRKIAGAASSQWDKAVAAYDKHLRSIRRKLPQPVRQLSNLCLHDAELIEFEEVSPNSRHAVAHVLLRQHGEIIFLSYFLLERPSIARPVRNAVFSPHAVQWLYDEIDCQDPGDFSHEILLSDGRVFRLRFEHLSILTAVASAPETAARRSSTSECA